MGKLCLRQGHPAIRVTMMPRDTNGHGSIFGGVLLSYIDQAGAVEAWQHTGRKVVTVAMDKVVFHQPVFVADVVSFYTELLRIGTTSITVKVRVESTRRRGDHDLETVPVTEAQVVYVAVDEDLKPVPVGQPPRPLGE